jgi:hypothetical protein
MSPSTFEKILGQITDPATIALLIVIYFLCKLLLKKEEIIYNLTLEMQKTSVSLATLTELIQTLIYRGKKT